MARGDAPAFLFYFDKWRGSRSVQRMSFAERGMYWEMLIEQAVKASLPDDADQVADLIATTADQVTEVKAAWPTLRRKFATHPTTPDRIINVPMAKILRERRAWKRGQQKSGSDGGKKRWGSTADGRSRGQRLADARTKGRHTESEWNEMCLAYGRCLACGISVEQLRGHVLVKDHIIALYKGGDDSIQNLQPLCRQCNLTKGGESTDYRLGAPETRPEWIGKAMARDASHSLALTSDDGKRMATSGGKEREGKGSGGKESTARSKRPIFSGRKLTVHEWMLDDLLRMLDPHGDAFDLHEWFFTLDQRCVDRGESPPDRDGGQWLKSVTLTEAQRRGLPLRVASAEVDVWAAIAAKGPTKRPYER